MGNVSELTDRKVAREKRRLFSHASEKIGSFSFVKPDTVSGLRSIKACGRRGFQKNKRVDPIVKKWSTGF